MAKPMPTGEWRVSEVARLAGVTVRTLHHYDEIGLLVPSSRTSAGHRRYTGRDVERLFQIRLYKEMGFPLEGIARVMDDPSHDQAVVLSTQRDLLVEQRNRLDVVIRTLESALKGIREGDTMSDDQMFRGLEALSRAPKAVRDHHAAHHEETVNRWGKTDSYKESMRRTKGYSKRDWMEIKAAGDAAEEQMARLLRAGASPTGAEAVKGAEELRRHISRWFYPCSREMHVGLAEMYEADPRFRAHYEEREPGLAAFVAAAIRTNAAGEGC